MNKKGFTLTELLAVIVVLGIITSICVLGYQQVKKSVDNKNFENVKSSVEVAGAKYANDFGLLTTNVDKLIDLGYIDPDDETGNIYDPRDHSSLNCNIVTITKEKESYNAVMGEKMMNNDECDTSFMNTSALLCNGIACTNNWYSESVTLSIIKEADTTYTEYYWVTNTGLKSSLETITIDKSFVGNVYLTVNAITKDEDGNNVVNKHTGSQTLKIDKDKPIVLTTTNLNPGNINYWASSRILTINATDGNGSGIEDYYFYNSSNSNNKCNNEEIIYANTNLNTYVNSLNETSSDFVYCVKDKAGNITEVSIPLAMIDPSTLNKPDINASDNILSGELHSSDFTLNISYSGETPISGLHYYYGTDEENVNIELDQNNLNIPISTNAGKVTYYVQVCNGASTCSEVSNYVVLTDDTPPEIDFTLDGSTAKATCSDPETGVKTGAFTQSLTGTSNVTFTVTCENNIGLTKTESHTYKYNYCKTGADTCQGGYVDYNCDDCYYGSNTCRGGYVSTNCNDCYSGSNTCEYGCTTGASHCNWCSVPTRHSYPSNCPCSDTAGVTSGCTCVEDKLVHSCPKCGSYTDPDVCSDCYTGSNTCKYGCDKEYDSCKTGSDTCRYGCDSYYDSCKYGSNTCQGGFDY